MSDVVFGMKGHSGLVVEYHVRHALSCFNMSSLPTNQHIYLLVSEYRLWSARKSRMTANALWLKHGWITANAPMRNGVGRFIPQLARVTLKFCKGHGGSNGVSVSFRSISCCLEDVGCLDLKTIYIVCDVFKSTSQWHILLILYFGLMPENSAVLSKDAVMRVISVTSSLLLPAGL